MTENQSRLADTFLRVLQMNGGTQNIDIITNQLEELGIDIEENPLDFEIAERYLIHMNIIEKVPPDNYFYNSIENIDEVVSIGIIEFVKQREEQKKQPQITGHNVIMNIGDNSQGSVHDSSSHHNTRYNATSKQPTVVGKIIVGVIIFIVGTLIWSLFGPKILEWLK